MENSKPNCFSPFYKVKKITFCLRLLFGFPLTPIGNNLDQYKFDNLTEFLRYIAGIIVACLSAFVTFYLLYKGTEIENPILSIKESFKGIGYSGLDIGVLIVISPINHICNFAYFLSFKQGVVGINKISRHLTKLNEEFHHLLFENNHSRHKNKTTNFFRYFRLFFLAILAIIASVMLTYSWSKIVFRKYSSSFATGETVSFIIAMYVSNLCYIYPPMMKSADFVVCYLLEETKDVLGSFRLLLSQQNRKDVDSTPTYSPNITNHQHRNKIDHSR